MKRLLLLAVFFTFSPSYSAALDREQLGDECYDVIHKPEEHTAEEIQHCRQTIRQRPTLVITPTRTERDIHSVPASVSVVEKEELERKLSGNLASTIRDVPGVEITDAGQAGQLRVRLRGEEARRVTILFDGQEFSDQREVGTPLLLSPEMVERIEVVRGPSSVLYGSRAIGGVVNFITKKGGYHPAQGEGSVLYDSATDGVQGMASFFGSADGFDYRIAAAAADHNDRDTPDGKLENTSFENESLAMYVGKRWDKHNVGLRYDNYQSSSEVFVEEEVRTHLPFLDFSINVPQRDREKIALFYDSEQLTPHLTKVHVDTYYQSSEREFETNSLLSLDIGFPLIRNSNVFTASTLDTIGSTIQFDWLFEGYGEHRLITGAHFANDELDQSRLRNVTNNDVAAPAEIVFDEANQTFFDLYVQDEWSFAEPWTLTGGLRHFWSDSELEESSRPGLESDSTTDNRLVASASLMYQGIRDTTLYGGWSQGYLFPTLVNLATGAFAGPDYVSPNPDLDPETSNSYELGGRYDNGRLSVDTSVFTTISEDLIDHVPCSAAEISCVMPAVGRRDRVYINVDEARTFGAEVAAGYSIDMFRPYFSATLVRRRFERGDFSTYKTGLSPFYGRLGVEAERYFSPNLFAWGDVFLRTAAGSEEEELDGHIEDRGGWTTFNTAVGLNFGQKEQIRVSLELLNLTDKRYIPASENLVARGRSAIVRVSAQL